MPRAKASATTTSSAPSSQRPAQKAKDKRRKPGVGVSLSTKLVTLIIVLLAVGTASITLSIRELVSNYLMEKTDSQLLQQSELVFRNTDMLEHSSGSQSGLTSYYVKVYSNQQGVATTLVQPVFTDGVVSSPVLPNDGDLQGHRLGVPFTTDAVVSLRDVKRPPNHATLEQAEAPWRVVALTWVNKTSNGTSQDLGIVYIGLSLSDQLDTLSMLTRFCVLVGIAVVLLGGVISALVVQRTLKPLKRIEKTAAQIADGDLSQRIPEAPVNTEVGSLSRSLNKMLGRIEHSFKEQEATTEKMKQFVSDASHELRTPLAAIHGYAELYKMQRAMPDALERADDAIGHIEASSTRMTALVEDLLSLARLDEGRGVNPTQQIRMSTILNDSIDDLHALDPEREIGTGTLTVNTHNPKHPELIFHPGDFPDVTLNVDGNRLHQVVTNIVGNIHRYTPANSPVEFSLGVVSLDMSPRQMVKLAPRQGSLAKIMHKVSKDGAHDPKSTQYVVARFTDHGPGVPEDKLTKIFERFYTADPSRARQKGGTGLGMSIVLSVVQAHYGFICASRTPTGGLTYTMLLPLSQDFREQRDEHES